MSTLESRGYFFRGTFYPETCAEIKLLIEKFNMILDGAIEGKEKEFFSHTPQAIIVPHAGYAYSGFTANAAYRAFSQNGEMKRIFIIGPSHHHYFEGISGGEFSKIDLKNYDLEYDLEALNALKEKHAINFTPEAHKEHSTETQFPFIKFYFPDIKAIEMVYGKYEPSELENLLFDILSNKENGVIISTDLSHFYTEDEANSIDNICLHAIQNGDAQLLHRGCEACGAIGVEAIIKVSKKLNLTPKILDYRTSSWSSGDKSRVVGYTSAIYY